MQAFISRISRSTSLKVFSIGVLILVLLIPLSMIEDVIYGRDRTSLEAKQDIQRTWGNAQLIGGPILVVPYDHVTITDRGERFVDKSQAYLLPSVLEIDAQVDSETRYRGIYEFPVYTATIALQGTIAKPDFQELGIDDADVHWAEAFVALAISDARAIAETPAMNFNSSSVAFIPGGNLVAGFPTQIQAPIGDVFDIDPELEISFDTEINLKGSGSLQFLPLGDTTRVEMTSPWPSPSFSGNYLPDTRDVSDDGFSATWRISSIGRSVPARWTKESGAASAATNSAFGVEFYVPVSVYRLTLRAVKYGVLFVGLTFVSFFMFEVVAGLRLHPLQYLLVGLANVLFYLLLISLAEHIGFGIAFLISCAASGGLVIGYSRSVLGSHNGAAIMTVVLTVLYSFLYMTLKAESYALLAGSLGLWATLGMIMYLTRRIDWHNTTQVEESS